MSVKQLPSSTRKLISCSQVITSVSSVVKELVENAVDAGAINIEVKLENNGLSKIEVKDNGCGIISCDMMHVCLPSYTSKIVEFSDLESLASYGFRGEALSALCQLADVVITTRTLDDEFAMSYSLDRNGMVTGSKLSHHSVGSQVVVSNLFHNLPVRKQFLNSGRRANEELKRVESIVKCLAVIHPGKRITLTHNKCLIWQKHAVSTLKQSLMQAIGYSISVKLEELNFHNKGLDIQIFIPEKNCGTLMTNTTLETIMLFVNKRPVRHKKLEKMMLKHIGTYFEGQLVRQRYPHCLLSIETLPSEFDINLEPNKSRVLFKEEDKILACLENLLTSYYNLDSTDEITTSREGTCKGVSTKTTKHTSVDEVGSCDGERPQKKARVHSVTCADGACNMEHASNTTVHDKINGVNYEIHMEESVPEYDIMEDSRNVHKENNPSDYDPTVGHYDSNIDNNLEVGSHSVDNICDSELFSFRNDSLSDADVSISNGNSTEHHRIKILAIDNKHFDTSIDDFSNLMDSNGHTGSNISSEDTLPTEFPIVNNSSTFRNADTSSTSHKPNLPSNITGAVSEQEWEEIDKATEKWSTHNYAETETNNSMLEFPSNGLGKKLTTHSNGSLNAANNDQNDDKKQSSYNTDPSRNKHLWNEDSKESEKWSSCRSINGNSVGIPTSEEASLDIVREKWATGCMTTVEGRTLQGSSVLIPSANLEKQSPSSSGDRSVCSQMGQKENSALTKFSREVRPQILAENPGIPFTKVAGMIVDRWRSLNEDQKVRYKEMAKEVDKERQNKRDANAAASACLQNNVPERKQKSGEKSGKFQKLLKDFITVTPGAKTKACAVKRPDRKLLEIDLSLSILNERLDRPQHVTESSFELIGQLKPSNTWLYRQGKEIGVVRHWGLQETILFDKLLKNHSVPIQLLEENIILNKRDFEPDLWNLLLSLDKSYSGMTNTVTIACPAIAKNGFRIEIREDDDSATCLLSGVASTVRFYGVPELKEVLQLIQKHGFDCSLDQCRPPKIRHYIMGDAVRMARESPSLDRESLDELLVYWHNNISIDEYKCLHQKPLFMPVYNLNTVEKLHTGIC